MHSVRVRENKNYKDRKREREKIRKRVRERERERNRILQDISLVVCEASDRKAKLVRLFSIFLEKKSKAKNSETK